MADKPLEGKALDEEVARLVKVGRDAGVVRRPPTSDHSRGGAPETSSREAPSGAVARLLEVGRSSGAIR